MSKLQLFKARLSKRPHVLVDIAHGLLSVARGWPLCSEPVHRAMLRKGWTVTAKNPPIPEDVKWCAACRERLRGASA